MGNLYDLWPQHARLLVAGLCSTRIWHQKHHHHQRAATFHPSHPSSVAGSAAASGTIQSRTNHPPSGSSYVALLLIHFYVLHRRLNGRSLCSTPSRDPCPSKRPPLLLCCCCSRCPEEELQIRAFMLRIHKWTLLDGLREVFMGLSRPLNVECELLSQLLHL